MLPVPFERAEGKVGYRLGRQSMAELMRQQLCVFDFFHFVTAGVGVVNGESSVESQFLFALYLRRIDLVPETGIVAHRELAVGELRTFVEEEIA